MQWKNQTITNVQKLSNNKEGFLLCIFYKGSLNLVKRIRKRINAEILMQQAIRDREDDYQYVMIEIPSVFSDAVGDKDFLAFKPAMNAEVKRYHSLETAGKECQGYIIVEIPNKSIEEVELKRS